MKVLITGGAGFIAYHLALSLKADGHEVCGFDNFNDYYDKNLKFARKKALFENDVKIVFSDLTDPVNMESYIKVEKPDVVMHLGAYAGVRHSLDHPDKYVHNNIVGTHNLIQACELAGVSKVVYASTSCVMAGNAFPWKEDEKLGYQLNPYGYSKATNEAQFMASKLDVAIGLRFFTVYGPWGRPDMALFTFTKNIIEGTPIKLFNYGDMIRDFTYVDDVVQANIKCMNYPLELNGDIFNIGHGDNRSVNQIADMIGGERVHKDPVIEPKATLADNSKARRVLDFKPSMNIEEWIPTWKKDMGL